MLIIGIAGGSGSGKSTVVKQIIRHLPKDSVSVIPQDAYYKDNGHLNAEDRARINFDHPSSIEFGLLIKPVDALKAGSDIEMPKRNLELFCQILGIFVIAEDQRDLSA